MCNPWLTAAFHAIFCPGTQNGFPYTHTNVHATNTRTPWRTYVHSCIHMHTCTKRHEVYPRMHGGEYVTCICIHTRTDVRAYIHRHTCTETGSSPLHPWLRVHTVHTHTYTHSHTNVRAYIHRHTCTKRQEVHRFICGGEYAIYKSLYCFIVATRETRGIVLALWKSCKLPVNVCKQVYTCL